MEKARLSNEELNGTPTGDFEFTLISWEKPLTKEAIVRFSTTINQIAEEQGFKLVDPVEDKPQIILAN